MVDFTLAKEFTGQTAWDALDLLEFHEPASRASDICLAGIGEEHAAHPRDQARLLVVEKKGSI